MERAWYADRKLSEEGAWSGGKGAWSVWNGRGLAVHGRGFVNGFVMGAWFAWERGVAWGKGAGLVG